MRSFSSSRGVSLIDVVVGSALMLVIFMGLFGILRASIQVSGLAKLKAAATEIASSRMEYVRSLAYASVGTIGGIPAGPIPQLATTTNSGIEFSVRTYIAYVDDPADGEGIHDGNDITTDYKVVRVSVFYDVNGIERDVTLISNVAPKGIESTTGGGTLRVSVVDALGAPVPGAQVRVRNTALSPSVDFSTFSDFAGIAFVGGAPASADYRVEISKTGYSSAGTYERTAENANPTPGWLTVIGGSTTSGTFAIDLLAPFTLSTFSPIRPAQFLDSFTDGSGLATHANTTVSGGALTLSGAPGAYPGTGSARSVSVAPERLAAWTSASSTSALPPGTSVRLSIADASGALLPDSIIPGNAAGITGPIPLSSVSTTTYPALSLIATLATSDLNSAPAIQEWALGYETGPHPLPNVSFTLTGAKTIGSTAGGAPLYKTVVASTTGASAQFGTQLEWDAYTLTVPGYQVLEADPEAPYEVLPGVLFEARLILELL